MTDANDARERRRQRAEANRSGPGAGAALKRFRVPLVIVLLWGAGVAIAVTTADANQDCPGHWHSSMSVFVEGDRVLFTPNPSYTLEGGTMPMSTHMHRGSESLWHFEPTKRECIPLGDALKRVEMDIGPGRLELSGDYHQQSGWGGTHTDNGTHSVQAWIKEWEGDWEAISIKKLDAMQVPDGAEVIIAYGDANETALATLQSQATPNTQTPAPGGSGSGLPLGPLFGLTAFALVGLLVWRSFTKGVA